MSEEIVRGNLWGRTVWGKMPGRIVQAEWLVETSRKSSGSPVQDYKSLRACVMICDTMVNTQTHTQIAFDWLYCQLSQLC